MTRGRWLAATFTAILLLVVVPADATAQCMLCGMCRFGPGLMCVGVEEGTDGAQEDCGQQMRGGHCGCRAYGGSDCDWPFANASEEADSELAAVLAVKSGAMLKSDGPYYFVVSENTAILRRKCDHALIARVALNARNGSETSAHRMVGG